MTCQESFAGRDIVRCQVTQYGGTHSAALRSALLPFPASSLPRELVSGRHLPLPEAVGGHVRRTAPPDERHGDEDIHHWKTV